MTEKRAEGFARERAKVEQVVAQNFRGKHDRGEITVEILNVGTFESKGRTALEIRARAWRNGEQLGFGPDGSVDVERFRIYNPPILHHRPDGILRENPGYAAVTSLCNTIRIVGKDGTKIRRGKVGRTTSTFYPEAESETFAGDWLLFQSGADLTWSAARDGAGNGSDAGTGGGRYVGFKSDATADTFEIFYRFIANFYTEALPDTDIISSAVVSLFGTLKLDEMGVTPNMNVYSAAPTSPTGPTNSDFATLGTTPLCDTPVTYAGYSEAGYNNWALNATGIAAINKTGVTSLGFRNANYDVANTPPTWSGDAEESSLFGRHADNTGTSEDPMLVVEHSAGGGSTTGTTAVLTDAFLERLGEELDDLVNDDIRVAGYTSAAALDAAFAAYSATNEIAGTGYTAGGEPVVFTKLARSGDNQDYTAADVEWTGVTLSGDPVKYFAVYNSTLAGNPTIAVITADDEVDPAGANLLLKLSDLARAIRYARS